MTDYLKRYLHPLFRYNWKFGLFLIFLFGIPRFIIVLQTNITGNYSHVMFVFLAMWFAPFLLLTKKGRTGIGIKRPNRYYRLLPAFATGILSCIVIFALFHALYDASWNNAFAYIGRTNATVGLTDGDRLTYFLIAAIPSMIFSPIGEEFLYRGIIHGSFQADIGDRKASYVDSLAFGVTHLAHFGILYNNGNWSFAPVPALLWVISMVAVSQVFFRCKLYCDSVFGAVAAHSGFNLAMMYGIFYHIAG